MFKASPIVFAAVILVSNISAATTSIFQGNPLGILTCEALLKGNVRGQSVPGGSIIEKIHGAMNAIVNFEQNNHDVRNSTAALTRLIQLESEVRSESPRDQTLVFEFRGRKSMRSALRHVNKNFESLKQNYKNIREDVAWPHPKFVDALWFGSIGFAAARAGQNLLMMASGSVHQAQYVTLAAAAVGGFMLVPALIKNNRDRFDSGFKGLIYTLDKKLKDGDYDDIFVSSQKTTVPEKLNSLLMFDTVPEKDKEDVRRQAYELRGKSYMSNIFRKSQPGDHQFEILTDHIVYFDLATQEPVWLFVVRSHSLQESP